MAMWKDSILAETTQKLKGDEMKLLEKVIDEIKHGINQPVILRVKHVIYIAMAILFVYVACNCRIDYERDDIVRKLGIGFRTK